MIRGAWTVGIWVAVTACSGGEVECVVGFEPGPGDACYAIEEEPDPTDPSTEDTDTPTGDTGTEPTDTGEAPEPPTIMDFLEGLPACGELAPDPEGTIDLDAGCVGEGCVGMLFSELEGVYGPATCEETTDPDYVLCYWEDGDLRTYVGDVDLDGLPDGDFVTYGLWVGQRYPGATEEGLLAGIGLSCFVDRRGVPTFLDIEEYEGSYFVGRYGWDDGLFYVTDYYDALGNPGGDGIADWVYLNP